MVSLPPQHALSPSAQELSKASGRAYSLSPGLTCVGAGWRSCANGRGPDPGLSKAQAVQSGDTSGNGGVCGVLEFRKSNDQE